MIHGCSEPGWGLGVRTDPHCWRRMAAPKHTEIKIKYSHPEQPPGRFTDTLLLPASSPTPGPAQETPWSWAPPGNPWEEAGKERRRKRKERGRADYKHQSREQAQYLRGLGLKCRGLGLRSPV